VAEDTPYSKYEQLVRTESDSFFTDDILGNRNLYDNYRYLLDELRDVAINQTYRVVEKDMTEKAVNTVKDRIKKLYADASKQLKKQGRSVPKAQPEEPSVFEGPLGKYVKSKQIPLVI